MPTIAADPAPSSTSPASPNVQAGVCPLCGAALHNPDACDRCDWVQGYGHTSAEMRYNPRDTFAGIVSLLWPGIGHFYKGHTRLAIALAAGPLLCLIWGLAFLMFLGPLIFPIYWLAVAAHAYFEKDLKHPTPPAPPATLHPAH